VKHYLLAVCLALPVVAAAADAAASKADTLVAAEMSKVIAWRRDIHQHPELSNREFRTAKLVAAHLKSLGFVVETGVAKTGVLALLDSGKPGPTLALRADMDALPVAEQTQLPFMSHTAVNYRGESVGVMHACGHDSHTAMLMGVAEVLGKVRADLRGKVLFIFQPAEEGAPAGEEGGAALMLKEGLIAKYHPDAVFGLHVTSLLPTGYLGYRSGPMMAASDFFSIAVKGVQAHGGRPWSGVDPIVAAAEIVNALQSIVSRQIDITLQPAVLTIGAIKGGVRNNIVPDSVDMLGTLRTFDAKQRLDILARIKRTVENTAAASGASATLQVATDGNPVVVNNPELTEKMLPTLQRVAGRDKLVVIPKVTFSEDFAHFALTVPGLYFFIGVTAPGIAPETAPPNHSPLFMIDENGLPLGVRAMTLLALDYLAAKPGNTAAR
jgi:amidohydrolase